MSTNIENNTMNTVKHTYAGIYKLGGVLTCKTKNDRHTTYNTPSELLRKIRNEEFPKDPYGYIEIKKTSGWINLKNYKESKYSKRIRGWNKNLFRAGDQIRVIHKNDGENVYDEETATEYEEEEEEEEEEEGGEEDEGGEEEDEKEKEEGGNNKTNIDKICVSIDNCIKSHAFENIKAVIKTLTLDNLIILFYSHDSKYSITNINKNFQECDLDIFEPKTNKPVEEKANKFHQLTKIKTMKYINDIESLMKQHLKFCIGQISRLNKSMATFENLYDRYIRLHEVGISDLNKDYLNKDKYDSEQHNAEKKYMQNQHNRSINELLTRIKDTELEKKASKNQFHDTYLYYYFL